MQNSSKSISKKDFSEAPKVYAFKDYLTRQIILGRDTNVSFDNFPYYLSENTKQDLLESTFLHLKGHEYKIPCALPGESRVTLLSGPTGSEIYQEVLVKALANHFDTKLLIFDCTSIPEELSGMDSQTLQDYLSFNGPTKHKSFKIGDRVIYNKSSKNTRGPSYGDQGKVFLTLEEEGLCKLGVRFDNPIEGSVDIGGLCEGDRGFFCSESDLELGSTICEDIERFNLNTYIEALFKVGRSESVDGPIIFFMKNCEMINNVDRFKVHMVTLNFGLHVTCPHVPPDNCRMEKVILICSYIRNIHEKKDIIKGSFLDVLSSYFSNKVIVETPKDAILLANWKKQIKQDVKILKTKANLLHIRKALSRNNLWCNEIDTIRIRDQLLTKESADKVARWAQRHHLLNNSETNIGDEKYVVSIESIQFGLTKIQGAQNTLDGIKKTSYETKSTSDDILNKLHRLRDKLQNFKKSFEDTVTENDHEKDLLSNVIPPSEIGVSFEDVGALDQVKETLKELITIPLQRPELFSKGELLKPCKGFLLFGPPGTGKTMLAKAVATECGANFLNISMSSIASRWHGEAEKYIKAMFTLASKIAPCVIFIDEIDSMLGKTGSEIMRSIKNEFLLNWDGLNTKEKERVIVLAATNRPFDLDEAVIRRLPRRVMISLPDAPNRAKILKKILEKEELAPGVDFEAIATVTEGYSGCDLKELCVIAAHIPIREFLAKEKEKSSALSEGNPLPPSESSYLRPINMHDIVHAHGGNPLPSSESSYLRPINMHDILHAHGQVSASAPTNGANMAKLLSWNEEYGGGGSRERKTLTYFI
ncbi:hypothetical protein SUGI_0498880 [Cryptomeria japonica]|nr:hypothetical protein SUGI_0498880 [Cryptomeria japonica]